MMINQRYLVLNQLRLDMLVPLPVLVVFRGIAPEQPLLDTRAAQMYYIFEKTLLRVGQ